MALRNRIIGQRRDGSEASEFMDPIFGVNLYKANQDLQQGEAVIMQNFIWEGGTRIRNGSQRLTPIPADAFRITGGHKFYQKDGTGHRLISYDTHVYTVSDAGTFPINHTNGMTSNQDCFFVTWPITDAVYISNGTDAIRKFTGSVFSTVTGTAIPQARARLAPILDRLMAITVNGIERTDPRSDSIWSNNSSWATLRPQLSGTFTSIHPYTVRGTDSFYNGIIAHQANAYYIIGGTDFGADVTSGTASAGEDAFIKLLDPNIGTSSPYSVCTVPGVGLFWFTSDQNVFYLPEGSLTGRYVGDKIRATGDIAGCEAVNTAALKQVWMVYHDRKLILGLPLGTDQYATTQFWMDIRRFQETNGEPVWYGPMTGQSVGRVWVEKEGADNALMGGEGNSAVGGFVYRLNVNDHFSDAVGTNDNDINGVYQTMFEGFGAPSREKYVRGIHLDINPFDGPAAIDVYDLPGLVAQNLPIEEVAA